MHRHAFTRFLASTILALGLVAAVAGIAPAASQIWSDRSPADIAPAGERLTTPTQYRALAADMEALRALLADIPLEGTPAADSRVTMELPLPDGRTGRFAVVESPILAPELQALYPDIRTYAGYGIDDPSAYTRFDLTPHGFHAIVLSRGGTIYVDPFQRGDITHYQSYFKRDNQSGVTLGGCTVVDEDNMAAEIRALVGDGYHRSGTELRTYRLAVAATGEYTAFHGGTVPLGLAAATTTMNRVTGVYEREVSIRMQMVANNNLIIYTNGATDPYTNNDGFTMLAQNQSNLDNVIGTANYDIGHVFSTGGGGIAGLGVVCRAGQKARGVTGLPQPIGDNFAIDYVAHEMGHQYGGNHSFNGNSGSCSGGNRNAATAYEPGSGSTIMAYAGICPGQNLQPHSDDYFHWINIQEIVTYSTQGAGNACAARTPTGAIEPTVSVPAGGFTIPMRTPFSLTASAVTTGAASYCWEESDLGPAGAPNSPTGNAPIFRSFDPVIGETRLFPKLSDLLNNQQTMGEILPIYGRNLSFRCTVRDAQVGGVGVRNNQIAFFVAAVGPFLVTSPNTAVSWAGLSQHEITWDVASTDIAPVNCANVNILLSTDGGVSWPLTLTSATPNDGTELVTLPAVTTTTARVKVEAADNVFFDISNVNFEITFVDPADVATLTPSASGLVLFASRPNPSTSATTIAFSMPRAGQAALRLYDPAGRLVRTLAEGFLSSGSHQAVWDGNDASGRNVGSGVYLYELNALGEKLTGRMTVLR